jgi:hypothetical protein
MKKIDLNKNRTFIILTIVSTPLLIISTVLAILTGGFTVWDRFTNKNNKIAHFKTEVEPMIIEFDSAFTSDQKATLWFNIETSGGIYEIDQNICIDSFTIIDNKYFIDYVSKPSIALKEEKINKYILDNGYPNLFGLLKFKLEFILSANQFKDFKKGEYIYIANFKVIFPYLFEGKKYFDKSNVPVYIKI